MAARARSHRSALAAAMASVLLLLVAMPAGAAQTTDWSKVAAALDIRVLRPAKGSGLGLDGKIGYVHRRGYCGAPATTLWEEYGAGFIRGTERWELIVGKPRHCSNPPERTVVRKVTIRNQPGRLWRTDGDVYSVTWTERGARYALVEYTGIPAATVIATANALRRVVG